ncbi:MAG: hypothetical protein FWG41_00680 [Methanomassiliicoccaceae archaeon]|nr:hypothetical protein [Methanomassiliicoccaceae archaeon]
MNGRQRGEPGSAQLTTVADPGLLWQEGDITKISVSCRKGILVIRICVDETVITIRLS